MVTIEQLNSEVIVDGARDERSQPAAPVDEERLRDLIRQEIRRVLEKARRTEVG